MRFHVTVLIKIIFYINIYREKNVEKEKYREIEFRELKERGLTKERKKKKNANEKTNVTLTAPVRDLIRLEEEEEERQERGKMRASASV